jgi:hypothetical protein
MIAIESILFLIGGVVLAVVLVQVFARPNDSTRRIPPPGVRLVRVLRSADRSEEIRLTLNDRVILTASSEGLRPSDYADEVERLEQVASRMAGALGVSIELARVEPGGAQLENGVPVKQLPKDTQ